MLTSVDRRGKRIPLGGSVKPSAPSKADTDAAFVKMAAKVDAQNVSDPRYQPISGAEGDSLAYQAACALVFDGVEQSNGYTEPLLHRFRERVKETEAA